MDECVLVPSPNWFLVSGLTASEDGWLVYGGPTKSLCVLEPISPILDGVIQGDRYRAHVFIRLHPEKITSVDISPEWPVKRAVLAGSVDGAVKQWTLELCDNKYTIKCTHSHEVHHHAKEEVIGVGYSNEVYAVTVGNFSNIVKWDLKTNVVRTYNKILKNFKPICMSCSRHIALNVAVGTKQGVVFVLDLTASGKILYKVRGQDDEIVNLSWCPQYEVFLKKYLNESEKRIEKLEKQIPEIEAVQNMNVSAVSKELPKDSFDESEVSEDDMFDIYKDHEPDEFGHKKYESEDILVKVQNDREQEVSYLDECMKLKEEILKRKNESESSIVSLVEALDKTHVDCGSNKQQNDLKQSINDKKVIEEGDDSNKSDESNIQNKDLPDEASVHTHKHLLATIGKHGGVRIWSKTGKLVASCAVPNINNKNQKSKYTTSTTLLWYKPNSLLVADGKSQLLECHPLEIDCKKKLVFKVLHAIHKRGLYCIASDAPRVQFNKNFDDETCTKQCSIWSIAQDRSLVRYSLETRQRMAVMTTCGGFLYYIQSCPYDAKRVAIAVGDGAVRVWEADTTEDDTKLCPGNVTSYWQNVQGKVLTVAWHPRKENLLAFATAESRVGLIDTNGNTERPARTLVPALSGGVYSLCWGERDQLYACAGGKLILYHTDKPHEDPQPVHVEVEGQPWQLSTVRWRGDMCAGNSAGLLLVGSLSGGVAVLESPPANNLIAATFVSNKTIYNNEWHPQQTSESNEESPYKNLIAVSSLDKQNIITILEYGDSEDGKKQLRTWRTLSGHKNVVLQVAWNPHRDLILLSTSQDKTVRVWEVSKGECISKFSGHDPAALGAVWCALPGLDSVVISGGSDCSLRLWRISDHSVDADTVDDTPVVKRRRNKDKKYQKKREAEDVEAEVEAEEENHCVASAETKILASKKFLLPVINGQISSCLLNGVRKMLQIYKEGQSGNQNGNCTDEDASTEEKLHGADFVKIFGSTNDVNEILDQELAYHLSTGNIEAWIMLNIFRGHIDAMVQRASQRDLLCPYIVSIAPCVSTKYWKDVTQLYVAQINRLVAKGDESKLSVSRNYGGPVFRKVGLLLSVHDVKGAVAALLDATLYKEAYVLTRTRHMDSIAEDILHKWAKFSITIGVLKMAAICYIALGDLTKAATILCNSNDEGCLSLAADLAKVVGYTTYADHIEERKSQIKSKDVKKETDSLLEELPTRIELLMRGDRNGLAERINGEEKSEDMKKFVDKKKLEEKEMEDKEKKEDKEKVKEKEKLEDMEQQVEDKDKLEKKVDDKQKAEYKEKVEDNEKVRDNDVLDEKEK